MEPITVPELTVSFAIDLDVEYDSFSGRSSSDLAVALADEIETLLYEASSSVKRVYVSITGIESND
jgi:hypothetical protein